MENNFWTDDLVEGFIKFHFGQFEPIKTSMEQFKSSKTRIDWEVVAFTGKASGLIYRLCDDGKYGLDNSSTKFSSDELLIDEFPIHSIRRLSDDWIVSVKDKVKSSISGRIGIIKSLDATGHILFEDITGLDHATTIEKLPVPVLTTVDGVEIYPDHLEPLSLIYSDLGFDFNASVSHAVREKKVNEAIIFSTREAAEAFAFDNRPSLSLKDLRELMKSDKFMFANTLISKATELIKQKNK